MFLKLLHSGPAIGRALSLKIGTITSASKFSCVDLKKQLVDPRGQAGEQKCETLN